MSEVAITQDTETGKFLPENIWRYKKGQSGHPARYNYKSMRLKLIGYVTAQIGEDQRYTWAGLAEYLGMSRGGLDAYRKGIKGKDSSAIQSLLDYYCTKIESQLEQRLTDRQYATAGVIKAIQATNPEKWGDHQTIDIEVKQQISIVVDQGSVLEQRFIKAGVTIDQPMKEISDG